MDHPHPHSTSTTTPSPTTKPAPLLRQFAAHASQTVAQWTARTYTLPDKNVASQVLMYRQLLHTPCRTGLKLSRPYQGTPAQVAVRHMPWWSLSGVDMQATQKMEISYDNLLSRLWWHGAIQPWQEESHNSQTETPANNEPPPIPHAYWVDRLGFQQTDPVTDFRSGGVLSLAMMVWMVESCPAVHQRFIQTGDAAVLPFGITSINITDMMARFLMLSKAVDRMDALLSQKTFWRMFADPNALLACQELSMDLLADVVVELNAVRRKERELLQAHHGPDLILPAAASGDSSTNNSSTSRWVTVFDFAHILAVTEQRVERDVLGAGPGSVAELWAIHAQCKARYQQQLQAKLKRMERDHTATAGAGSTTAATDIRQVDETTDTATTPAVAVLQQQAVGVGAAAVGVGAAALSSAGHWIKNLKSPGFHPLRRRTTDDTTTAAQQDDTTEAVVFGVAPAVPEDTKPAAVVSTAVPTAAPTPVALTVPADTDSDGDWVSTEMLPETEQIANFSIDDDEDI